MKYLVLGIFFLVSSSAISAEKSEKFLCQVGNENALKGPGFPTIGSGKNIPSKTIASFKLGDWSEEGHYTSATSEVLQYGLIIQTEEQLKVVQSEDPEFKAWTSKLDFPSYLERQKTNPHGIEIYINASLREEGIQFSSREKMNTFNMDIGLLPPYEKEAKVVQISYSNLEAPVILGNVAISCKTLLPRNKLSYKNEIKRLKSELRKM